MKVGTGEMIILSARKTLVDPPHDDGIVRRVMQVDNRVHHASRSVGFENPCLEHESSACDESTVAVVYAALESRKAQNSR